jgi:hypothetical protein
LLIHKGGKGEEEAVIAKKEREEGNPLSIPHIVELLAELSLIKPL